MTLLVTAFERFGPWERNSTVDVAERVAAELPSVTALTLPVDLGRAPALLRAAIAHTDPDAVLCLGLHGRARAIRVERAALNLADFSITDNAGRAARSEPVVAGSPDGRLTGVHVRGLVEAMRADGVPADVSNSAGTYLCNAVYFVALDALHGATPAVPCVFLHLPPLPGAAKVAAQRFEEQRARGEGPPRVAPHLTGEQGGVDATAELSLDQQVRGALIAARALLGAS